ncbi:Uncharacterised protein [Providencia rustigianii]|uniref:Uncharacterized protein n=2 Tax=Providencia rustigianii TaxID=158850 RepID=A0A379G8B3_9GAMM|nr:MULTISPECIES: hypothetical protein [Providencia]MTC55649.1 hypothetical protein [Providencia rustigianii]SUC37270.1 Uncharacterised protein [Providencia rustigianii]
MDNRRKDPHNLMSLRSFPLVSQAMQDGSLQLGYYRNRGRIAKVYTDNFFIAGLKSHPQKSESGETAFGLMSWLLDKPRLPGEKKQSYLLSALNQPEFSGFEFNSQQNLWVDSFHSPHQWHDGEPRSQAQLVDLLLPSGEWHRHYGVVVLSINANDQQVALVRHWLELTGGSLIILDNQQNPASPPIQKLLEELDSIPIEPPSLLPQPKTPTIDSPSGILVTAYPAIENEKNIEKSTYSLANLTHYASGLPKQPTSTTWVYEGVLTAPKSQRIHVYLDTLYVTEDLTFEVAQQTQQIRGADESGEIVLHHVPQGKQIDFKITTTTNGQPPDIRLGWGFADKESVEFIPNSAIRHSAISIDNSLPQKPKIAPVPKQTFLSHRFNQVISLPPSAINRLVLDQETLQNSHYFSISLHSSQQNIILKLDDVAVTEQGSWEDLTHEIEDKINQQLSQNELPSITLHYADSRMIIQCDGMTISQFQLKNQQILPILVVENSSKTADKLVIGTISGQLPIHEEIHHFQILESPLFGRVDLDPQTGEWHYLPDSHQSMKRHDQFDITAVMKDGSLSAPMSIHLNTEDAPLVSKPGKRIFTLQDPIYSQPKHRYQPVPHDMQVHGIQLAQTHLLAPDAPYFSLTANRWALLKVDITSPSSGNAPDLVAIIRNKAGNELEKITLIGPSVLPSELDAIPQTPSIDAQNLHRNSYTAPIKGMWIQPDMQIQIMAGNTPVTQPYTDSNGVFLPTVKNVTPMTSHVTNTSLYRQGHGTYAYSPLSWGLEASAKLPTHQFTLFSYPSTSLKPMLYPYVVKDEKGYVDKSTLIHPTYDSPNKVTEPLRSQIGWAYFDSQKAARRTQLYSEFFYSSIEHLPMRRGVSQVIGLATHNFGGGITKPSILWHEVFGHGLSLGHTTKAGYPYSSESHGGSIAYDQQRQQYTTYRKDDQHSEIIPAMYPADYPHYTEQYDAFLAHCDYLTYQAQSFLASIDERKTPREYLPVYQLNGTFLTLEDGTLHPYSRLVITETLGQLIPKTYRDTNCHLVVIYATQSGLLSETISLSLSDNELNLNIPNKGELVRLDIIKTEDQIDIPIFQYRNPESLANRVFIHSDDNTPPEQLQMDDYWQGSPLFWSASQDNSVLRAKWVTDGQHHQQFFSLQKPFGGQPVDTQATFIPLNHLELLADESQPDSTHLDVQSEIRLLSDVNIHQTVDIRSLRLNHENLTYWVTLVILDSQGKHHETMPLESWYLEEDNGMLTIRGTLDSTPNLNIAGIKVYIDQHLSDEIEASSILIYQNDQGTLAENSDLLNYDRPVEFNALISQMAGISEDKAKNSLQAEPIPITSTVLSMPLVA